jgi:hypothetical protein
VVAAVVAASAGVSAGLLWGMHILPSSHRPVGVVPLDSSHFTAHPDSARAGTGRLNSAGYPDAAADLDLGAGKERDRFDPGLESDPGKDPDLDVTQDPTADAGAGSIGSRAGGTSVPDHLSGDSLGAGTSGDDLKSVQPYSSDPAAGGQTHGRPRADGYPDPSRSSDGGSGYSRAPEERPRRRLPGVDQDSMPGLGGL